MKPKLDGVRFVLGVAALVGILNSVLELSDLNIGRATLDNPAGS